MQTTFSAKDIQELPQRYRTNLINSLAGYKQAALVGSISKEGNHNVALFNSVMHIGASPPLYGLLFRPETVRRDTLQNIRETGSYTINYVPVDFIDAMHQTSARYAPEESEFNATGLTPEWLPEIQAPFVQQAAVKIAMRPVQEIPITANDTTLLIGRIEKIMVQDIALTEDGFAPIHEANITACCGLDAYYNTQFLKRLPYARP